MNAEFLRDYCLAKPAVTESFPFDDKVLVFKVADKMFALCNIEEEDLRVNLKCDPERAIALREEHDEVQPGYHMNKKHWNTVMLQQGLERDFIIDLIDHSYDLVVASLPKKVREELSRNS